MSTDDVTFIRLTQFLEDNDNTVDTSRFSLVLDPSLGCVVLEYWGYPELQEPDLAQLQIAMPRSQVLARENLRQVRDTRGKMLADTDFLFLSDSVTKTDEEMQSLRNFRQALRDVPQNIAQPEDMSLCIAAFPQPPATLLFLIKKYPQIFFG